MTPVTVSEVFGPTVQGEGPLTGRLAVFVRLGRCDLDCSWCDTPYTWDRSRFDMETELTETTVDRVLIEVAGLVAGSLPVLVITGGEPLLQRAAVVDLASSWPGTVQIETNGRHAPPVGLDPDVLIVASPKLGNSGVDISRAIQPAKLAGLNNWGAHFKFVVSTPACVDSVDQLVGDVGIDRSRVWLMPEGTTGGEVLDRTRWLVDQCLPRGYQLSTRLHTLLWGNERAR